MPSYASLVHAHHPDVAGAGVPWCCLRIPLEHATLETRLEPRLLPRLPRRLAHAGIALGALVQGIHIEGRAYAGGWWDWLTPFSILTGLATAVGYVLLGATWLVMKTEGAIQERMRRYARIAGMTTLAAIGLVSILTPFQDPVYWERWFAWPTMLYSGIVPLLLALAAWTPLHRPARQARRHPVPCLAGHLHPVLRRHRHQLLSAHGAAIVDHLGRSRARLKSCLHPGRRGHPAAGHPVGYTAYAYWVFKGKVKAGEGYH
jgi:cytochrome d ubiquinol oxidase subunit II